LTVACDERSLNRSSASWAGDLATDFLGDLASHFFYVKNVLCSPFFAFSPKTTLCVLWIGGAEQPTYLDVGGFVAEGARFRGPVGSWFKSCAVPSFTSHRPTEETAVTAQNIFAGQANDW
jgi:hypothetical protein